jgi:cell division protein FtsB
MNQNKNKLIQKFQALTDTRVLGLLAFGVVALLVTWSGIKAVQTNYELEKRIAIARQNSSIQKLENENLKLKNHYYESAQYLELSARRQFGKAAPGESLYTVPEEVALSKTVELAPKPQTPDEKQSSKPRFQQNFDDWVEFLFN